MRRQHTGFTLIEVLIVVVIMALLAATIIPQFSVATEDAIDSQIDSVMERESGLSKAEREMIVVATSAANDCLYCVVAHGAIARIRSRDPHLADQVAIDWRKAPLSARMRCG